MQQLPADIFGSYMSLMTLMQQNMSSKMVQMIQFYFSNKSPSMLP